MPLLKSLRKATRKQKKQKKREKQPIHALNPPINIESSDYTPFSDFDSNDFSHLGAVGGTDSNTHIPDSIERTPTGTFSDINSDDLIKIENILDNFNLEDLVQKGPDVLDPSTSTPITGRTRAGTQYLPLTPIVSNSAFTLNPLKQLEINKPSLSLAQSNMNQNPTAPGSVAPPLQVQLLPSINDFEHFSGEHGTDNINTFMEKAEGYFDTNNITKDDTKIAIIKRHISSDTRAWMLIHASIFKQDELLTNYAKFKDVFLNVMGTDSKAEPLSWVKDFAQTLGEDMGKLPADIAFAKAGMIRDQIQTCIQNWTWQKDDETMTKKNFLCIMEYVWFYCAAKPEVKHLSRTKEFKATDQFYEHVKHIRNEIAERDSNRVGRAFPVAKVEEKKGTENAVAKTHMETGTKPKNQTPFCNYCKKLGHTEEKCLRTPMNHPPYCPYCKKTGHTEDRCFAKRNSRYQDDRQQQYQGKGYHTQAPRKMYSEQQYRQPHQQANHSQQNANYQGWQTNDKKTYHKQANEKWCEYHQTGYHDATECKVLLRYHDSRKGKGQKKWGDNQRRDGF